MQLGSKGNTGWLDTSDFLVHFTKDTGTSNAYDNMLTILSSQHLRRGDQSFGFARTSHIPASGTQQSVCMSEVPLGYLRRLIRNRSKYGIGFPKKVLTSKGATPVWYLEEDSVPAKALHELMRRETDPSSPLWKLTPNVDELRGDGGPGTYRFEWEREWRVNSDLHFNFEDVAFLFMDETYHETARDFFEQAGRDDTGPCYTCPFIDPAWDVQTVEEALQRARRARPI